MLHIESQGFFLLPCVVGTRARGSSEQVFGSDVGGGLGRIRPFQLAHPLRKFLIRDGTL